MDILDLLSMKDTLHLSGTYRGKKASEGEYFEYETIDAPSRSFGTVINNLIADTSNTVIKTNFDLKFKVGGFVVTQDDCMYTITSVKRTSQAANKEVLSIMRQNPATEYLIAMSETMNERGVQ